MLLGDVYFGNASLYSIFNLEGPIFAIMTIIITIKITDGMMNFFMREGLGTGSLGACYNYLLWHNKKERESR